MRILKKINNYFFTEEEQNIDNYFYFYGFMSLGFIILVFTILNLMII